jgi:hypothetical protein
MSEISIKHAFNAGDLLSLMPGLRQINQDTGKKIRIYQRLNLPAFYYDGSPLTTLDKEGNSVCMNIEMYHRLRLLIESQEYIKSFEIWQGEQVDMDFDITRHDKLIPMPAGTLHSYAEAVFPEMAADLSVPCLKVETESVKKDYYKDKIIINRTQRYTNPYITYYFLKDYQDKILFSGTEAEHAHFCDQWNLSIEYLKTDNFYQVAQIISWCKFGIYNQSLHFHIADSLKTPRILELCPQFPNTFVTGKSGFQFYKQSSLEYSFHKLLNA